MSLTPLQKQALADDLVNLMERFQRYVDHHPDTYEAVITQPSSDHLVIKIQPAHDSADLIFHR
ncbi:MULTISPECIES: hypothetical protein [Halomonadaceae]|uniref:Uncharacterized protein n=2 Tax=Vreelandella TaxID=3137766 RepID=A0A7Z0LRP7_9GAMM|nr:MULTISPECIES: hypothetical protein [Halomonas]NYS77316.1 hypothetical protein [Halomonas glaciei]